MLRYIIDSFCVLSWLNISSLKNSNYSHCSSHPSTSFLSTLHSHLDYAPNTEASTVKTVATYNNLEVSFEVDCTRVTIKTQTTKLTLPKDLWRTLEAARHHNIHLAEEKSAIHCFPSQLFFKPLKKLEENKGLTR